VRVVSEQPVARHAHRLHTAILLGSTRGDRLREASLGRLVVEREGDLAACELARAVRLVHPEVAERGGEIGSKASARGVRAGQAIALKEAREEVLENRTREQSDS